MVENAGAAAVDEIPDIKVNECTFEIWNDILKGNVWQRLNQTIYLSLYMLVYLFYQRRIFKFIIGSTWSTHKIYYSRLSFFPKQNYCVKYFCS